MRLLASRTHWARGKGYALAAIRGAYVASFTLIEAGHRPRFRGDVNKDAVEAAKLFITYLEDREVLTRLPTKTIPPLVAEFTEWAREQAVWPGCATSEVDWKDRRNDNDAPPCACAALPLRRR